MLSVPRICFGAALIAALSAVPVTRANPVLPGGGTLTGTVSILSTGSIEYTEDVVLGAAGATIAVGAVEFLVVGGGGGGGSNGPHGTSGAGGGGAGGLVDGVLNVAASSYDVAVGVGGAGGAYDPAAHNFGSDGGNSQLGDVVGLGGGGGSGGNASGRPGGSGGGGRGDSPIAGGAAVQPSSPSGGFGNSGGTGTGSQGAGGGGGAGTAGSNASGDNGGNGGTGRVSAITGEVRHYAGGGGGGGRTLGTPGTGGSGIGGNGANNSTDATQGATNTGSGGGGGNNSMAGADGGSGVVYVRYAGDGAVATGGDAITSLTGAYEGYTLHAFTTTGDSAFALNAGVSLNQVATLSGALSGSGGLTVAGPGTLILTGTNAYTGATTIAGGTLAISEDANLGAAPGTATAGHLVLNGGALATTGDFTLSANRGITLGGGAIEVGAGTLTYGGNMSGSGALTKTGAGILKLTGSNTYTGGIVIKAGTVRIASDAALGAAPTSFTADNILLDGGILKNDGGSVTLNANRGISLGANHGRIEVRTGTEIVVSGAISGTGNLTKLDGGTLVLAAENTYSGTTTISSGAVQVGNGGTTGSLGTGNVANGATLAFNRSDTLTVANSISGSGVLLQVGTGTTVLTGANTYSGTTTISAGTLQVGAGGTIGVLGTGSVINESALVFNRSDTLTVANSISGSGSLHQAGTGTTVLTGANTYSGTTTISAGTLQVGGGGTAGELGAGDVTNNGILAFNRSNTLTVANGISGSGGLLQTGTGTTILTGANTYTGTTTITAGRLQVSDDAHLGEAPTDATAGKLVLNGGSLMASESFTLNANRGITAGGGAMGAAADKTLTYGGVIAGGGSLGKTGDGTLILSGQSTYTGGTEVQEGVLAIADNHRLPTATALTLADTAGAAFDLAGHNQQIASLAGGGTTGGSVVNTGASTSTLTLRPTTDTAYNGLIVGNIRLEVTGNKISPSYSTPRQRLTNANNSYTGGTLIDGGTLLVSSDGALGALPGTFDPENITLQNNGVLFNNDTVLSISANRGITLGTGGGGVSAGFSKNVTINSEISGAAGNNLTILGNSGTVIFSANNTYAGETRLASDTSRLQIGAGGTTGSLGTGNVINGGLLSFNRSNDLTVANAISGAGNLVQAGAGTTTLTGANTYTGTTTVTAGTLLVNGTHTGARAYTVNSGATLGGTGSIGGATTVNNGGRLAPGAGIGTLAFTSDLTLKAGSTLLWEFMDAETAGNDYDTINGGKLILPASGTVNLSILGLDGHTLAAGDSFVLFSGDVYQDESETPFDFGDNLTNRFTISDNIGWWGTWELTAGSLVLTAVPEPGTLAMLLISLTLLAWRRRRRR